MLALIQVALIPGYKIYTQKFSHQLIQPAAILLLQLIRICEANPQTSKWKYLFFFCYVAVSVAIIIRINQLADWSMIIGDALIAIVTVYLIWVESNYFVKQVYQVLRE